MPTITPTIDHARTFASACLTHGLACGLGTPQPGQMCIEALWCHVLGLPHDDAPQCVSQAVRRWKIRLNDAPHESASARAACLVRVGVAQIGSLGIDAARFSARVAELTIREILPPMLRVVATRCPGRSARLLACAERCETEGSQEAARDAAVHSAAATVAATTAAAAAHRAAAAAAVAASYAADATNRSDYLQHAANIGERVLREMEAPGIAWLDQLEAEGLVPPMRVVTL